MLTTTSQVIICVNPNLSAKKSKNLALPERAEVKHQDWALGCTLSLDSQLQLFLIFAKSACFPNKNSGKNSTKASQLKNKILVSWASYRIQSRILVGFPFSKIEIFRIEIFFKHKKRHQNIEVILPHLQNEHSVVISNHDGTYTRLGIWDSLGPFLSLTVC